MCFLYKQSQLLLANKFSWPTDVG